ncbi:MAG: DNA recombination protein RmuC [Clostridiales bacterium]|jgi:DNA recombination protein RmuC|nr:DNA recombination protein RmuC [Clostridiales bacterium]
MDHQYLVLLVAIVMTAILQIVGLILQTRKTGATGERDFLRLTSAIRLDLEKTRLDMQSDIKNSFGDYAKLLTMTQEQYFKSQEVRLRELSQHLTQRTTDLQTTVNDQLGAMNRRLSNYALENEQKLESIRQTINTSLGDMRVENGKKLDEMRATVDEKLQKTLEERISKSFTLVSERLEQVYKGLGEMQTLAAGVGDLKKILSNVKTRGVLGEVQLGAILEQMMAREQYEENVAVKNGPERVEYAIKLPGNNDEYVYLPIDAKFPADVYAALTDAYDRGDKAEIDEAAAQVKRAIRNAAKLIHDKYIEPPYTTEFAIMFLPIEGLYAEVVRAGLVEQLQREYKITIAGPTTMAALLNSFQMGFKTLAIQKYSSQVWDVLGKVKAEFDKFGTILSSTQRRLHQASDELETLVGVRTRAIQRNLRNVGQIPASGTDELPEPGMQLDMLDEMDMQS